VDTTRWQVDTMPAVLDAEGDAPPDGIAVPELQEDEKIQYIKRGVSTFVDTRYCATVIQRSSVPRHAGSEKRARLRVRVHACLEVCSNHR